MPTPLRDPPKPPLNRPFSLPSDASTPDSETPTTSRLASPSLKSSTLDPPSDGIPSESSSASEGSSSSASEDGSTSSKPRMLHHSSSSFLMANAFAPPFYNRPPTPLPPSPSLTSLLRPPFSTTTSRPSTPDSSENDTPNETESAVTKSARIAAAVPRASPKVPTYEYYGFVLYVLSTLAFLLYLLWSYLPCHFLHQLGIYYYPNRWWSLAIPSFLVMSIVYIYVALASYNTGYLTLPMGSIENIVDEAAHVAVLDGRGNIVRKQGYQGKGRGGGSDGAWGGGHGVDWRKAWSQGTDAVMDVPIGGVCEILYGERGGGSGVG